MKPYARNPRRITKKRYDRLADTLARLGDLGGIVHNLETDEVIGGNQRIAIFKDGTTVITETYDQPDEQGTVGHGFIVWRGHKFAYRQVRWDEQTAAEANIAANLGAGEWDWDALSGWDAGDLQAWGFDAELTQELRTDLAALDKLLATEAVLDEVHEIIRPKRYLRILISVPVDIAIDAQAALGMLAELPDVEIDYGGN